MNKSYWPFPKQLKEEETAIRKLPKPKYELDELVARMPRNYKVREESFDKPVGKEEL